MSIEEAKELLSYHSFRNENVEDPREINGFLGSLRPFKGELNENNFIEVMECMKVLQDEFSQKQVDDYPPHTRDFSTLVVSKAILLENKTYVW